MIALCLTAKQSRHYKARFLITSSYHFSNHTRFHTTELFRTDSIIIGQTAYVNSTLGSWSFTHAFCFDMTWKTKYLSREILCTYIKTLGHHHESLLLAYVPFKKWEKSDNEWMNIRWEQSTLPWTQVLSYSLELSAKFYTFMKFRKTVFRSGT